MFKRILTSLILFGSLSVIAHEGHDHAPGTIKANHGGTVKAGNDTLWVDFKFTNDGTEPLIISDVKTSCDCTLANWPKTAIQPGASSIIKGGFKIEGKSDTFTKNIIIMANTMPGTTFLTIKGFITPKE